MALIQHDTHIQHDTTDRPSDPLREALHRMWASVAPSWSQHATYVDTRGAGGGSSAMLEAAGVRPGDHVLELACGPGGVGLAAAERVGPTGSVVLSDVTAEMTSVAAARAAALQLTNVTTCELDLEHIDQSDRSHDVVLCREGLMLVPEPARALREIRRVLRPGGRACRGGLGSPGNEIRGSASSSTPSARTSACRSHRPGSRGRSPSPTLKLSPHSWWTPSSPTSPSPPIAIPLRVTSFDEWWTTVPSLAGPIAGIIASLPQEAADAIRATAHRSAPGFITPNGYDLPGLSLVASGTRR